MRICGIEIKGSEAIIVIINGTRASFEIIESRIKKMNLENDELCEQVKKFKSDFESFIQTNLITKIFIKKRNKKGEFAGGPVSFKLEGLIQLVQNCEVILVSPISIASVIKKMSVCVPNSLNKYQANAFETAFYGLED